MFSLGSRESRIHRWDLAQEGLQLWDLTHRFPTVMPTSAVVGAFSVLNKCNPTNKDRSIQGL